MQLLDIIFIGAYLLLSMTAFFAHLLSLYVKIRRGDTWCDPMSGGEPHPYKFSFYEHILGWGFVAFCVPFMNIAMIIYDIVYLTRPAINKLDSVVNNLINKSGK